MLGRAWRGAVKAAGTATNWGLSLSRGKSGAKVEWVRPPYAPAYAPEKSGDLEQRPNLPDTAIAKPYDRASELNDASEVVRRLFSVGHIGVGSGGQLARELTMQRVRRHQYDTNTAETKIARITGRIRWLQAHMEQFPRDKHAKKTVQEQIARRKQLLKFLRRYDYRKFEWLLERLNLTYTAYPESANKLSRRESIRKLTELQCSELVQGKLHEYRQLLESQQGPFLQQKLAALAHIRREQVALQLPLTVTAQDIAKVEDALQRWKLKDDIKKQAGKKKRAFQQ